jgi:hypothetical protein
MHGPPWLTRLACAAAGLAFGAVACRPGDPSHPPELGDCTPVDDAACTVVSVGGSGGPGGQGGADGGLDAPADVEIDGCATADCVLMPANNQCGLCIMGSCMPADLACQGSCLLLLQCVVGTCGASPSQSCVNACANTFPAGTSAYEDFVSCLSINSCTSSCPTLLTPSAGDF